MQIIVFIIKLLKMLYVNNVVFRVNNTVYHYIFANLASEPWVAKIRIAKIN